MNQTTYTPEALTEMADSRMAFVNQLPITEKTLSTLQAHSTMAAMERVAAARCHPDGMEISKFLQEGAKYIQEKYGIAVLTVPQ